MEKDWEEEEEMVSELSLSNRENLSGQRRREWSEAGLYVMSLELSCLWSRGGGGLVFIHGLQLCTPNKSLNFFRHWFPNGESGEHRVPII